MKLGHSLATAAYLLTFATLAWAISTQVPINKVEDHLTLQRKAQSAHYSFEGVQSVELRLPGARVVVDPDFEGMELRCDSSLLRYYTVTQGGAMLSAALVPDSLLPTKDSVTMARIQNVSIRLGVKKTGTNFSRSYLGFSLHGCDSVRFSGPVSCYHLNILLNQVKEAQVWADAYSIDLNANSNLAEKQSSYTLTLRGQTNIMEVHELVGYQTDAKQMEIRDVYIEARAYQRGYTCAYCHGSTLHLGSPELFNEGDSLNKDIQVTFVTPPKYRNSAD
jgi:hypothetical protein